jgi:hypothetical protein
MPTYCVSHFGSGAVLVRVIDRTDRESTAIMCFLGGCVPAEWPSDFVIDGCRRSPLPPPPPLLALLRWPRTD